MNTQKLLFFVSLLALSLFSTGCTIAPHYGPRVYGPPSSLDRFEGQSYNMGVANWTAPIIGKSVFSGDILHMVNDSPSRIIVTTGSNPGTLYLEPWANFQVDLAKFGGDNQAIVYFYVELPDGEVRPIKVESYYRSRNTINRYNYRATITVDNRGQYRVRSSW